MPSAVIFKSGKSLVVKAVRPLNRFWGWIRFGSAAGWAGSGHNGHSIFECIGMQGVRYAIHCNVSSECETRKRTPPARKNKVKQTIDFDNTEQYANSGCEESGEGPGGGRRRSILSAIVAQEGQIP
jgi:hypothetical protein